MKLKTLVYLLSLSQSWADTQTSVFTVSTTVVANCTISTNNLSFGNYSGTQVDASSAMTINCTNGTPYSVALNVGTGAGANFSNRLMTSGGSTMTYNLFTDTTRTIIWGDGTGGSQTVSNTGSGTDQTLTVYGRLTGSQTPATGTYMDTITATITY